MEQVIQPARRLNGEVRLPGEGPASEQAVLLAALAVGEGRVANASPAVDHAIAVLAQLGVVAERQDRDVVVNGLGPAGLVPPAAPLTWPAADDGLLLLLAILAGQPFVSCVQTSVGGESLSLFLRLLQAMGARVEVTADALVVGGASLHGVEHDEPDLDGGVKLAMLVAGLFAEGVTRLRESAASRSRSERELRQRGVVVDRRLDGADGRYVLSVAGGPSLAAVHTESAGDLDLAGPLLVAALALKGSVVRLPGVALRPGRRGVLDLLRQSGGSIDIEELPGGTAHLTARHSRLKATRIAGARAARLLEHVPVLLLAATQAQGESVIRDVEGLRQRPDGDCLAWLTGILRQLAARVGEFPEGWVIQGGAPLCGATLEVRRDAMAALTFGVAGLLAESEVTLVGAEVLDPCWPDFAASLHAIREKRR